jgi:glycerophosphoryl diester phosphodiesterase
LRALNAPAWLTEQPIAHRGLHDAALGVIENTLAAAEAAIAGGFAIECDVQLSADEEVFVFHDETLDRLTDARGALVEMSAAQIRRARVLAPDPSLVPASGETAAEGRMRGGADLGGWRSPSPRPSPRERAEGVPTFAELLALVDGRTPVICELKSRFNADWRIAGRIAALAATYEGPLAFKSFDPDLVAYLRLRWPRVGPPARPCPVGMVAEASYDDPYWDFLTAEQKRRFADWEELMRAEPDFLSFDVDDLPHKTPFFMKQLHGLPVMAWTVHSAAQREAARKWADQIVFEGDGAP